MIRLRYRDDAPRPSMCASDFDGVWSVGEERDVPDTVGARLLLDHPALFAPVVVAVADPVVVEPPESAPEPPKRKRKS